MRMAPPPNKGQCSRKRRIVKQEPKAMSEMTVTSLTINNPSDHEGIRKLNWPNIDFCENAPGIGSTHAFEGLGKVVGPHLA